METQESLISSASKVVIVFILAIPFTGSLFAQTNWYESAERKL